MSDGNARSAGVGEEELDVELQWPEGTGLVRPAPVAAKPAPLRWPGPDREIVLDAVGDPDTEARDALAAATAAAVAEVRAAATRQVAELEPRFAAAVEREEGANERVDQLHHRVARLRSLVVLLALGCAVALVTAVVALIAAV